MNDTNSNFGLWNSVYTFLSKKITWTISLAILRPSHHQIKNSRIAVRNGAHGINQKCINLALTIWLIHRIQGKGSRGGVRGRWHNGLCQAAMCNTPRRFVVTILMRSIPLRLFTKKQTWAYLPKRIVYWIQRRFYGKTWVTTEKRRPLADYLRNRPPDNLWKCFKSCAKCHGILGTFWRNIRWFSWKIRSWLWPNEHIKHFEQKSNPVLFSVKMMISEAKIIRLYNRVLLSLPLLNNAF